MSSGILKKIEQGVDRAVGIISPRMATQRAIYRNQYDGASKAQSMDGWRVKQATSPNQEIVPDLASLRYRSRDLVRNSWHGRAAIRVLQNAVVGTGIRPSVTGGRAPLGETRTLNELLLEFAASPLCDSDRQHDLYGLQAMVLASVVESGEALVIRQWQDGDEYGGLPRFSVRVLEPEHLACDNTNFLSLDSDVGIDYDERGVPKAYRIVEDPFANAWVRKEDALVVDASEVAHVFRVERPGQARGVPWFSPVMIKMGGLNEYEHAELIRQKLATSVAGFVKTADHQSYLSQAGDKRGNLPALGIQPGQFNYLGPGEDIFFNSPPQMSNYRDYVAVTVQQIAAGIGITYESLSGDYSKVNYSSGRMGRIEMGANVRSTRDHVLYTKLLRPWEQWFKEAVALMGWDVSDVKFRWTAPHFEMLDPKAEAEASKALITGGFSTTPREIRKFGLDPDSILVEQSAWQEQSDAAGVMTDTDLRKFAPAGAAPIEAEEVIEVEDV